LFQGAHLLLLPEILNERIKICLDEPIKVDNASEERFSSLVKDLSSAKVESLNADTHRLRGSFNAKKKVVFSKTSGSHGR
jgi:hypothetical protein